MDIMKSDIGYSEAKKIATVAISYEGKDMSDAKIAQSFIEDMSEALTGSREDWLSWMIKDQDRREEEQLKREGWL